MGYIADTFEVIEVKPLQAICKVVEELRALEQIDARLDTLVYRHLKVLNTLASLPPADNTLIIGNVDRNMLEEQRKELAEIVQRPAITSRLSEYEEAALVGVLNMLDEWSDEEWHKRLALGYDRRDEEGMGDI